MSEQRIVDRRLVSAAMTAPRRAPHCVASALGFVLAACALTLQPALAADGVERQAGSSTLRIETGKPAPAPRRANFKQEQASLNASKIAHWALDSGNSGGMPFAIVDKADAKFFVFDRQGQLWGAASALVGLARGDDTVPGIGNRKLSTIRPHERTTPAGRFVASLERSLHGDEILWVDYDAGIALHRVVDLPKERRLQRLASPQSRDRRITYGCINVPLAFFDGVVSAAFKGTHGIVYVLPEKRSLRDVFGSYDVDEKAGLRGARQEAAAEAAVSPTSLAPVQENPARSLESTGPLRY